jgi:hypothetical protein
MLIWRKHFQVGGAMRLPPILMTRMGWLRKVVLIKKWIKNVADFKAASRTISASFYIIDGGRLVKMVGSFNAYNFGCYDGRSWISLSP